MKKLGVLFLIVLVIASYGCVVQEETEEKVPSPLVEDVPKEIVEAPETIQDQQPAKEIEEIAETEEETIIEDAPKEEFQILNPVLKYQGAYNGPLYGTSEQVGSASMDSYFENLDKNGITFFIGMFGISGEPNADTLTSDQGLGEVIAAAQKHPSRIIPFFNPGIGGEEVEQYLGEELTGMYRNTLSASQNIVGKNFIRGFGEVETQEWQVRHNDQRIIQLINLAQSNKLHFMFHPVASKIDDV